MNTSPRVSDTERYLLKRAERIAAATPPLLVKLNQARELTLQLPDDESAAQTIYRRMAIPVAGFDAKPALVLAEQSDLEQSGLNIWHVAKPEFVTA
jgi:hypothetical protein